MLTCKIQEDIVLEQYQYICYTIPIDFYKTTYLEQQDSPYPGVLSTACVYVNIMKIRTK